MFKRGCCAVALGLVAVSCATSARAASDAKSQIKLPVADVVEVRDVGRKTYPGRVVSVAEVEVRPQVTGEILEVGFANGQDVAKGDVLYRLDPVKYRAVVKNAEAKVTELTANFQYAELTATRYSELVKTRAVSQDDLDHARSVRDSTRAALAAAEADLVAAKDDLSHCTIVAPIAGKVGSTVRTAGNYVRAGDSCLVTLVQVDPIRVCFQMSNADYALLFDSDSSRIIAEASVALQMVSGGETCATGRVEYVENVADSLTDTVGIYVLVANAEGKLLSGQTLMATIENVNGVRRPAVPPNAVAQDLVGPYVWVVGERGAAEKRRVVRGARQDGWQLLKSGVRTGERVVADGVHRVRSGMTVVAE